MKEKPENQVEQRLLSELEEIRKQISALEAEHASIERLLVKLRRENVAKREVTRTNSIDRLLVETQVVEFLKESGRPVPTSKLYNYARVTVRELKENTFRSQLHRMKKRGLIYSPKGRRGEWKLAENIEENT
ncbi:hypothetical protein [Hyphococcus luteus]|uniref:Uncharacterized protein n=1 Tax=Hyphococcus luteus TaxID=2058213 RepID=A0A2S7K649_9PROT|nr:hypothetical protein [Marinicaulis flavus]PQA87983.1 hypothetical protein CW354_06505 [Marinicaulis flavus]